MANTEEARTDVAQSLQCSFETSSSSHLKQTLPMNQLNIPHFNSSQFRSRHFPPNFSVDNKKVGIPPSHPHQIPPLSPYSQIPIPRPVNHLIGSQNHTSGPTHSRSLSQPPFFSLDSLPPLSPSPFRDSPTSSISDQVSADASMEDRDASSHSLLPPSPYPKGHFLKVGDGFLPRKAHRRSNSDVPFGFSTVMQSSPPLLPLKGLGSSERSVSGKDNFVMAKPTQIVKRESNWERGRDGNAEGMGERKSEGDVMEDLFSAYMNLDNIDSLNSSGTDEKNGIENREDLDSRASGTKTNGGDSSDNEAESRVNENGGTTHRPGSSSSTDKREGIKRSAGGDIAPTIRHYRSLSMDSFIGKLQFGDESSKMPPSPGGHPGHLSPSTLVDGSSTPFSLEFGNGEFSRAEMKKIMANDKLAEIAVTDPKRVKRILANRQSAARSKERKMRYITELEHKVQTLQTEATTLSAQLTLLQRDSVGLTSQNNELKFRLQAMEQQAQLRDALNEALTTEVQRLKLATTDINSQTSINPSMFQMQQNQHAQTSINPTMFQMQQNQQTSQHNATHLHQNSPAAAKPESIQ